MGGGKDFPEAREFERLGHCCSNSSSWRPRENFIVISLLSGFKNTKDWKLLGPDFIKRFNKSFLGKKTETRVCLGKRRKFPGEKRVSRNCSGAV